MSGAASRLRRASASRGKRSALPLLCALAFASVACHNDRSTRLEGRWRGLYAEGVAPDAQARANAFARSVEIVAHGREVTLSYPGTTVSGHVRLVHVEKHEIGLVADKDGLGEIDRFTFQGERTARWVMAPGQSIVLERYNVD